MTVLGLILFSAIETATVIVWAAVVFKPDTLTSAQVLGAVVLFIGYVIEHVIAFNVGKGRSFFEFPRP